MHTTANNRIGEKTKPFSLSMFTILCVWCLVSNEHSLSLSSFHLCTNSNQFYMHFIRISLNFFRINEHISKRLNARKTVYSSFTINLFQYDMLWADLKKIEFILFKKSIEIRTWRVKFVWNLIISAKPRPDSRPRDRSMHAI